MSKKIIPTAVSATVPFQKQDPPLQVVTNFFVCVATNYIK
jgi:hypothetical protein